MAAAETRRRQLRDLVAHALAEGASRADIAADLLCASRGIRTPGHREELDAAEISLVWTDADRYANDATGAASPG